MKNLLKNYLQVGMGPLKSMETRHGQKHKKTILLQKNCGKKKLEDYSASVA